MAMGTATLMYRCKVENSFEQSLHYFDFFIYSILCKKISNYDELFLSEVSFQCPFSVILLMHHDATF